MKRRFICANVFELCEIGTKASEFESSPMTPEPAKNLFRIRIRFGVYQHFKIIRQNMAMLLYLNIN